MARTEERENLMKMIYQMGIQNDFSPEEYERFAEIQTKGVTAYFAAGYLAVSSHLKEIDAAIDRYSVNWKISRLPGVDLAILRLALLRCIISMIFPSPYPSMKRWNSQRNTARKSHPVLSTEFWGALRAL